VPGGPGVRDDSGVYSGWVVPQYYDPMLSKLVAWAPSRPQAVERLLRALDEYTVHGITTNLAYLSACLRHPAFRSGEYDTGFCSRYAAELLQPPDPALEEPALIAAAIAAHKRDAEAAESFATRAGQATSRPSNWTRLSRTRALRGGTP
jgi:acetyl-CoA carboxylase biotin carboxylase subunit